MFGGHCDVLRVLGDLSLTSEGFVEVARAGLGKLAVCRPFFRITSDCSIVDFLLLLVITHIGMFCR